MKMSTVQSKTLQNQVYEYLHSKIVSGDIPPGQRLVEEKIAEETGISRSPIREAIRRLAGDGLVVVNPRGGVSVYRATFTDFTHVYECRLSLEPTAARFAAIRMSESQRLEMNKLMYDLNRAVEKREIVKLKKLSSRFHGLILEASHNPHLIKMMKQLYAMVMFYRNAILNIPQRLEDGANEHQAIWEAIQKQDQDAAEKLMREHIDADYQFYIATYKNTVGDKISTS
jgi:DNA-binding GntR family transcriptional regulator